MALYRHLCVDMIEVFKIVHIFYDSEAAVTLNFDTFSTTRGNKYKLQKSSCHYNTRIYSFSFRVVNMCHSLPNDVVEADTVGTFKNRLYKYWYNQDVLFICQANLIGLLLAKRTTCARQNTLNWIRWGVQRALSASVSREINSELHL